jgi:hypothetical protein
LRKIPKALAERSLLRRHTTEDAEVKRAARFTGDDGSRLRHGEEQSRARARRETIERPAGDRRQGG